MSLDPNYVWPYVGLGGMAQDEGDYKSALELFQKALTLHPENQFALHGLYKAALACNESVVAQDARQSLDALDRQPTFPQYPDPVECR